MGRVKEVWRSLPDMSILFSYNMKKVDQDFYIKNMFQRHKAILKVDKC